MSRESGLTAAFQAHGGLLPAVAQDVDTGEVLMLAWMSPESLWETRCSGRATYFSRKRQTLWRKGETSGHVQEVVSILLDCDSDSLLLKVRQHGPACHTGQRSCYFQDLEMWVGTDPPSIRPS